MDRELLSTGYRNIFVDNQKYSGHVALHLAGLASAVEDSHKNWRPTVSELIMLLPESEESNALVAAGMAYGAAKQMMANYPGPAILLFGAALNVIGTAPNTELQKTIEDAETILEENGLNKRKEIVKTIQAAKERASFDKVTQMLRNEFTSGLRESGEYSEEIIKDVVPKIVNVTHDVRHRGLIERLQWKNSDTKESVSSTDIGYFREIDEVIFVEDTLRKLLIYAQTGCAFSILRRLESRRGIGAITDLSYNINVPWVPKLK